MTAAAYAAGLLALAGLGAALLLNARPALARARAVLSRLRQPRRIHRHRRTR